MLAAMNSTSNIRLDKRDLILAKGAQVMTRRGYHGTGVQEIVQAAGIPKGSFYHYFASKEDFALQALEYLYAPRLSRYAEALGNPALSPRSRILQYYGELVAHFSRLEKPEYHCFIGSLSFEMAELCQPIGTQVESILSRSGAILAECLEAARTAGELAAETDCAALAEFIGNAWEGALMRMKVGASVASLQVFLNQLQRLLTPR
ncbi:MAG: TetR family transcriptional regulator [Pseudomonas sp.]